MNFLNTFSVIKIVFELETKIKSISKIIFAFSEESVIFYCSFRIFFRKNFTLTEERTLSLLQADCKLHYNVFLQTDSLHDN